MNYKAYMKIRWLIAAGIGAVVGVAAVTDNFYLAITGILIGILFMLLVKKKVKGILVDERVISISGQASRMTYAIVTFFLAILGLFLILSGRSDNSVYVEGIGVLFSYTAMLLMAVYSISFHYFNNKHGGNK